MFIKLFYWTKISIIKKQNYSQKVLTLSSNYFEKKKENIQSEDAGEKFLYPGVAGAMSLRYNPHI